MVVGYFFTLSFPLFVCSVHHGSRLFFHSIISFIRLFQYALVVGLFLHSLIPFICLFQYALVVFLLLAAEIAGAVVAYLMKDKVSKITILARV